MTGRDAEDRPRIDPAPDGRGTILAVRAQPGARHPGATGVWNGMLKVGLRAPAEDGRANDELLRTLADLLGVRGTALRIVSGDRSRAKRVWIDLEPADCARRVARALAEAP